MLNLPKAENENDVLRMISWVNESYGNEADGLEEETSRQRSEDFDLARAITCA